MKNIVFSKSVNLVLSVLVCFVFIPIQSCSIKNDNKTVFNNEYIFVEDSLLIKSNKFFVSSKFSYIEDGDKEILFFGCLSNQKFYSYNLQSNIVDTINPITNDNPIEFKDFYSINNDSIVLMDRKPYVFHLMDAKGVIFQTFDLRLVENMTEHAPAPYARSCNPVLYFNNNLCFCGYLGGEYEDENFENRPVMIFYNPQNKNIKMGLNYPQIYKDYNWAGLQFRRVFNSYNTINNKIILSFPASHNIYAYSYKNDECKVYSAGSKYIMNILPFSKKKEWFGSFAKQDYEMYYYKTPSYSELYYDKYRDLYYRIAELSNNKFSYSDLETYTKQKSIIIIDKNFNYVGEKLIKENFYPQSIFVSKRGLNIVMPTNINDTIMRIKLLIPQKI